MWTWTSEKGAYVLKPSGIPDRVEVGFIGRSLTGGGKGPLDELPTARLPQVHGADVRWTDQGGELEPGDAIRTASPGVFLTVRVADCAPVALVSADQGIGMVHAGWRGVVRGVLEAAMNSFPDPGDLDILIGPTIGVCCFEVGPEVAEEFPASVVQDRAPRPHLDLPAAIEQRLVRAGATWSRIRNSRVCTRCHQHLGHSHRGSAGGPDRMVGYVALINQESNQSHSP